MLNACRETTNQPVIYRIDVPAQNHIDVEIELTQRIGLGLAGTFNIDVGGVRYGSIRLEPETQSHGFRLGLDFDLGIFVPGTLGSFQQTSALPTGQLFASWVRSPMVDLKIPEANIPELGWDFYFGTQGRIAFGAAATITAINGNFPSISLDYAFRDSQGRLILGVQFYGPGRDAQGRSVPGGIFLGTDLTDLLPREALAYLPAAARQSQSSGSLQVAELTSSLAQMGSLGGRGIEGASQYREIRLTGAEASRYQRSPRALKRVVQSMLLETQK